MFWDKEKKHTCDKCQIVFLLSKDGGGVRFDVRNGREKIWFCEKHLPRWHERFKNTSPSYAKLVRCDEQGNLEVSL